MMMFLCKSGAQSDQTTSNLMPAKTNGVDVAAIQENENTHT